MSINDIVVRPSTPSYITKFSKDRSLLLEYTGDFIPNNSFEEPNKNEPIKKSVFFEKNCEIEDSEDFESH